MKLFHFIFFWSVIAYGETRVFEGVARHEGKIIYYEKHEAIYEDGKIKKSRTEYTDSKGKLLGVLENDFGQHLSAPAHVMKDIRQENVHGIRYKGEKVVMFNKNGNHEEVTKTLGKDEEASLMMAGQGVHYYLASHLEEVIRKKKLGFMFLIPWRLDYYQFYLNLVISTEKDAEFELKIDNWFLSLFAPRIRLLYDRKTKKLISYEGLSNLKNAEGELMSVDIQYDYHL